MSAGFELHPRLAADCHVVGDLHLSRLLLMDDARWPWLILVPRRADLRELIDLEPPERLQCMAEISACSAWLQSQDGVRKLNIGALGNVVPQLHIHVLGRWPGDPAWPAPVWGSSGRIAYSADLLARRLAALQPLIAAAQATGNG